MVDEQLIDIELGDGSSTKITVFQNGHVEEAPVIIMFPALGVFSSYYKPFAESLANRGVVAITADLRGNGHSSIRPDKKSDFGFHEIIELDFTGIIGKVNALFPKNKKYILGHSLGGQLGSLYMSKNPGQINGLILSASCSIYYKGWDGFQKWQILLVTRLFPLIASLVGYFPGKKVGFGGTEAKTLMMDWSSTGKTGKYIPINSSFDYEAALKKLEVPVLAISYSKDTFSPKRAVENLYNKYSSAAKITHKHLTSNEEDTLTYDHYNWAKNPGQIVDFISQWLDDHSV